MRGNSPSESANTENRYVNPALYLQCCLDAPLAPHRSFGIGKVKECGHRKMNHISIVSAYHASQ